MSAGAVLAEIAERSPLYRGVTLDEIGGRGVRWQEREASRAAAREVLGTLALQRAGGAAHRAAPRRRRAPARDQARPLGVVGDRPRARRSSSCARARSWC